MEAVKKAVSKRPTGPTSSGPSNPTIRRDPPQLSGGTKKRYTPDSRVGYTQDKFGGGAAPKRVSASPMRKAAARTGTTLKQRTQGRLKALGGTAPARKKGEGYNEFAQRVLKARRAQKANRIGQRAYGAYKKYNATK